MTDQYAYLDKGETAFFDERAGPPGMHDDLLNFPYGDDHLPEMLDKITQEARRALADTPAGIVPEMLRLGDFVVRDILKRKATLVRNGEVVSYDDVNFNQLNPLEFMPIVLRVLGDHEVMLGDEDLAIPAIRITPEMFCASYLLRMASNAAHCMWDVEVKTYYLMQASAAFGVLQSLIPASDSSVSDLSISDAVASSLKRGAAKRSASSRWSRLDDAKKLAFKRREECAELSRSAAIDKFLAEIVEECRVAGEPLTGGDPKRTVTDWFRKAGIK